MDKAKRKTVGLQDKREGKWGEGKGIKLSFCQNKFITFTGPPFVKGADSQKKTGGLQPKTYSKENVEEGKKWLGKTNAAQSSPPRKCSLKRD